MDGSWSRCDAPSVGRWLSNVVVLLCVLGAFSAAGAATARTSNVTIHGPTKPVYIGQTIQLKVNVRGQSVHCVATISYTGGKVQRLCDRAVGSGGATWSFRIPAVRPGGARAVVNCGEVGKASIPFLRPDPAGKPPPRRPHGVPDHPGFAPFR